MHDGREAAAFFLQRRQPPTLSPPFRQLPMPFVLAKMQAASDAMKKMKSEHVDAITEMEASCASLLCLPPLRIVVLFDGSQKFFFLLIFELQL